MEGSKVTKHRLVPWTVLILLVLVVWFFFAHGLAKVANPESPEEESSPSVPTPFRAVPHQMATASNQEIQSLSPEMSTPLMDFQKKIRECLPDLSGENIDSPEKLLQQEIADHPVQKTEFEMENIHIELPDGSLRRIHMIPSEKAESANLRELRYFKLDSEGFPERIELPEHQTYNPSQEFIDSLKSQGRMVFHQIKHHEWLQDGIQLEINQVDERIFEMQIFEPGKILSCRAMKCFCH